MLHVTLFAFEITTLRLADFFHVNRTRLIMILGREFGNVQEKKAHLKCSKKLPVASSVQLELLWRFFYRKHLVNISHESF